MNKKHHATVLAIVGVATILITGCSASPSTTPAPPPIEAEEPQEISNSTPVNAPSAIEGLAATGGDRQVAVTFSAPSSEDPSIDRYEYRLNGSNWQALQDEMLSLDPVPTFTLANLPNGMPVALSVRGVNKVGAGSDGSTVTATPMEPQQLTSSRHHSLVLSGSNVFVWGNDDRGQLGNGGTASVNAPTLVQPSEAFSNLSTGDGHTLALTESGELWSWGDDMKGQLGNGPSESPKDSPTRVAFASDAKPRFTRISAGGSHSLAIDTNGHLWSWGGSAYGALGNGSKNTQVDVPTRLTMTHNPTFMTVSAGYDHTLALDVNGGLWSWGGNFSGQLGNGNNGNGQDVLSPTKVSVPGNPVFADVKAGQYNSLALDTEGNIWGWGQKFATPETSLPTQLTDVEQGDATFVRIAAGYGHALAVDQEGKLHSWGRNNAGALGHGDTTDRITPTEITVAGQPIFMRLAAGDGFSVALDEDGLLWTWGEDAYNMGTPGRLGRGTAGSSSVPTAITSPTITF